MRTSAATSARRTKPLLGAVGLLASLLCGCDGLTKFVEKFARKDAPPKAGDACVVNVASCADANQILYCVDGKFAPFPCKGKKGCFSRTNNGEAEVFCDMSGNAEADACWSAQVTHSTPTEVKREGGQEGRGACSDDSKELVLCEKGKITRTACRGPKGCSPSGRNLLCDQSLAREGDACTGEGATCGEDGLSMLRCAEGKFVLARRCRGERCKTEGSQVDCDAAIAEVGDPCQPETAACSVDKKAFLVCKDLKFVKDSDCKPCLVDGASVRCQNGR